MLMKEDNGVTAEFIFLIPNMMFYTSIGFLTALKNKHNLKEIKNYLEKAAVLTENTTGELADVLIDNEQGLKALKEMQDLYLSKN